MSTIDVAADIEIAAAPADIAAVMFDPAREPEWIGTVTGVTVIDPALAVGARTCSRSKSATVPLSAWSAMRFSVWPVAGRARLSARQESRADSDSCRRRS